MIKRFVLGLVGTALVGIGIGLSYINDNFVIAAVVGGILVGWEIAALWEGDV
jgi:hypothetical protein